MNDPAPSPAQTSTASLRWQSALDNLDLLAPPVRQALQSLDAELADQVLVTEIDPEHADTATLTEVYGLPLSDSVNCVIVAGKRAGEERVAACAVRATTRADVNSVVRRLLDVRKASFWPTEQAVAASGMEYGGITPIGLPSSWRLLLDSHAVEGTAVVGSGLRRSKILLPGQVLAALPGAEVIDGLGTPGGPL